MSEPNDPALRLSLRSEQSRRARPEGPRGAHDKARQQPLPYFFFPEEVLHFTIYSLRRSRPQPFPPAELEELWTRLASELRHILEAIPPFTVSLRGLAVTADGAILIGVGDSPVLRRLHQTVGAIPGVSPPRSYPPHVTIGQVLAPCGSKEAFRQAMGYLQTWQDVPLGELSVPDLKMIYYSSRILAAVERWAKFGLDDRTEILLRCSQK